MNRDIQGRRLLAAMVVEAQYADFGNPARIGTNVWTQRFFAGVAAAQDHDLPAFVREPVARFEAEPADGGTDTRVRIAALRELPDAFEFALLRGRFAEMPQVRRETAFPGAFPEREGQVDPRFARVGTQEPLPARKSE